MKEGITSLLSYSNLATFASNANCTPSLFDVVKMLEIILEIYDNMDMYLHATTVLEDPSMHDIFLALQLEYRAAYLRFQICRRYDE